MNELIRNLNKKFKNLFCEAKALVGSGESLPEAPRKQVIVEKGAESGDGVVCLMFPNGWNLPYVVSGTPLDILYNSRCGFIDGGRREISQKTALGLIVSVEKVKGTEIVYM